MKRNEREMQNEIKQRFSVNVFKLLSKHKRCYAMKVAI